MERRTHYAPLLILVVLLYSFLIHKNVFAVEEIVNIPSLSTVSGQETTLNPKPVVATKSALEETATVITEEPLAVVTEEPVAVVTEEPVAVITEELATIVPEEPETAVTDSNPGVTLSVPETLTKSDFEKAAASSQDVSHYSWLQPPPPDIEQEGQEQQRSFAKTPVDYAVDYERARNIWWMNRLRSFEISQRIYWPHCAGCHGFLPPPVIHAMVNYRPRFLSYPPTWTMRRGMGQAGNMGRAGSGPMYSPRNNWQTPPNRWAWGAGRRW